MTNDIQRQAPESSTSLPLERKFVDDWLDGEADILEGLSANALMSLPYLFEVWALDHQLPPPGDWSVWLVLGGRGAGKTRAGAEWVRSVVEGGTPRAPGTCRRVALIAETLDQAREVMVHGESGILACSPPDRRPRWHSGRRMLEWPNGATAQTFSASDPESLRGPQFDAAWVDELAKWKKARETWDMLQFGLRLGDRPRVCATTTPRAVPLLAELMASEGTVTTSAPTSANRINLAPSFVERLQAQYEGTRLGRQELDGELVLDRPGALWPAGLLELCREGTERPLDRVVVAVDPPVTAGDAADECGIVVVGAATAGPPADWHAVVLEDASVRASPQGWIEAALAAMARWGADRLVAEVNQGGDLIETLLRQTDPGVAYKGVRASRGKAARAEPAAALYEQGRVAHRGVFRALEEQMGQMTVTGFEGQGSPDRVDALVWALTELLIEPMATWRRPGIRML